MNQLAATLITNASDTSKGARARVESNLSQRAWKETDRTEVMGKRERERERQGWRFVPRSSETQKIKPDS
jgi:hypothetical protein